MDLTIPDVGRSPARACCACSARAALRPLGIEADRAGARCRRIIRSFAKRSARPRRRVSARRDQERTRARSAALGGRARAVVLAEEMAYWDRGVAISLPGPGLGGPPVALDGHARSRSSASSAPSASPTEPRWGSFAMTEPGAGSDVAAIRTSARRDGDALDPRRREVVHRRTARARDWIVVWATVDPALGRGGHRAFVVERGTPGLGVSQSRRRWASRRTRPRRSCCEAAACPRRTCSAASAYGARRLQGRDGDVQRDAADRRRDGGRHRPRGARRGAAFAREQFTGASATDSTARATGSSAIRRKLRAARLLAGARPGSPTSGGRTSSRPRWPRRTARRSRSRRQSLGIEILGEAGAARDHLIEKLFRDVKAMDIVEGTGQIQRLVMARHLVEPRSHP